RIIGGGMVRAGRFPYAVSLQDDVGHFCGGSLIAKDVVLTAAHCSTNKYSVVIGTNSIRSKTGGDRVTVKDDDLHPNYNWRVTNNDFMLVFLARETTADVTPVRLNTVGSVPDVNDAVTVMGWGDTIATDNFITLSEYLLDVEVNVVSNKECASIVSYTGLITESMICAKDYYQDSCQGDSGGPLVVKGSNSDGAGDVLVGVVSWGIGCASPQFPGVYARVSS
ncbi:trypsin-like serine protease, partial [Thalassiosira pseudonana CCMP1335]